MGLFGKKEIKNEAGILSVSNGEIRTLASLKDGVFSEKMMGDGIVVCAPKDAKTVDILAPVSGELVTVFPTGHAYGIKTKDGIEILVHIGVDTVNLDGKGFKQSVKQGKKVNVGEKLVTVDLDFVRKNAPTADAIILVTSGQELKNKATGSVNTSSVLFEIK